MPSSSSPVVLTIDDEESVLISLKNYLEDCNFKVLQANNGRVGLELFDREKPDIVLVDLRMPEVDGLDVLRIITRDSPTTPILVVSGTGNIADAVAALHLGAWDYLLKPIADLSILEHAVNKALERARLLDENRAYQENLEEKVIERTKALQASERRFRLLFENAPIGLAVITPEGKFLSGNEVMNAILVGDDEKLSQTEIRQFFINPQDCDKFLTLLDGGKEIDKAEVHCKRLSGEPFWASISITSFEQEGQKALLAVIMDITDRKQTEEKIKKFQGSLRESRSQLAMAEENERRRIAQGLHDGIAQDLAALAIQMQFLRDSIDDVKKNDPFNDAIGIVQKCIDEVKSLTFALSPTILFELGYEAAVEWLVDEFKGRFPATFKFNFQGYPKSLSDNKSGLLFRSVRELLVNAVKHSKAKNVRIDIKKKFKKVITCVEDDGIGFDMTTSARKKGQLGGYGLFSISEQMEHVGGEMKVESSMGSGTRVTLSVPEKD